MQLIVIQQKKSYKVGSVKRKWLPETKLKKKIKKMTNVRQYFKL